MLVVGDVNGKTPLHIAAATGNVGSGEAATEERGQKSQCKIKMEGLRCTVQQRMDTRHWLHYYLREALKSLI
jgi:hypothetical protein